jgi:hypothetical protein
MAVAVFGPADASEICFACYPPTLPKIAAAWPIRLGWRPGRRQSCPAPEGSARAAIRRGQERVRRMWGALWTRDLAL